MTSKMNVKPLWDHQKRGIQAAEGVDNLGIFFEVGTGKSRTVIEILRRKFIKENRLMRTVIFAPKIVVQNWCEEIEMYSKIPKNQVIKLTGTGKKRAHTLIKELTGVEGTLSNGRIVVMNYETLQMKEVFNLIKSWNPEVMVCDESHRLKNHESKRAKKAVELADTIKYKYILTGTPILNSAMDIFNQFRVLDGGETFGKNFWVFRNQWFEDENAGFRNQPHWFPKFVPRPETYVKFNELIYKKAVRAIKSECLDLPPLIKEVRYVGLGKEQEKAYKEMKNEFIAYLKSLEESGEPMAVVAQLAITKALRLQQILSGFAKTEEGSIYRFKECPRIEALHELLEDITPNHKVIVWATFKENYKMIADVCKELKLHYVELHGEVSEKDREMNLKEFRTGNAKVMIANQGAGGIGINMVEASYAIYYSGDFSNEKDQQSEARNYRGGSHIHEKVTRIDLVTPETIDQLRLNALYNKQDISKKILDWKKDI